MGGFYCVSLPVFVLNSWHVLLIMLLIYFHMVGGNRPDENKHINCCGDQWLTNCGLISFAIKFFHNNLSEGEIGWELTFLFCITRKRLGAQSAAYLSFLIIFLSFWLHDACCEEDTFTVNNKRFHSRATMVEKLGTIPVMKICHRHHLILYNTNSWGFFVYIPKDLWIEQTRHNI